MSTLKQRIKDQINDARKNAQKDKLVKLSTLMGEIQKNESTLGKDFDDQAVAKIVKKFVSGVEETIEALKVRHSERLNRNDYDIESILSPYVLEKELYFSFLPKEMSAEDLENIISKIISEVSPESKISDMGKVMKTLKEKSQTFENGYDGKMASEIVKRKLK